MIFVLIRSRCCRLLLPRASEKPERGTTTTDADGGGMVMCVCGVVVIMDPGAACDVVVARYSLLSLSLDTIRIIKLSR